GYTTRVSKPGFFSWITVELDKKQLSPPKALPTVPVRHTPVVEFSSTGGLPPLFLIHAADGYTLLYNELVDRFDSELPVYGLPSPALYGASLESIESLAAQHVATIRRVRPKGPYLIAGYCMGGDSRFGRGATTTRRGRRRAIADRDRDLQLEVFPGRQ
uniref:thioesterase domain-containing protein n=1 Tax=Candidatus Entotheonella palauensis TaxID=93172 RepID=UPI00117767CC